MTTKATLETPKSGGLKRRRQKQSLRLWSGCPESKAYRETPLLELTHDSARQGPSVEKNRMNWPTPAPGREPLKKQLGFLANVAFLRNGSRCDFHHKAIDLARMSGTIAHATHAAYAGLRIGRKIVGGNRSHRTRRRQTSTRDRSWEWPFPRWGRMRHCSGQGLP